MPRQLRIEYPGAIYHVMNRRDRREAIFRDGREHLRFLETLGEDAQKFSGRFLRNTPRRKPPHLPPFLHRPV